MSNSLLFFKYLIKIPLVCMKMTQENLNNSDGVHGCLLQGKLLLYYGYTYCKK